VRLRKLYKSKKWDQMVFFNSRYDDNDPKNVPIGFKVRNSTAAYAYDDEMDANCAPKIGRKGRSVWVDVPAKCRPWDGQTVQLDTYTGKWQSDARPFFRDHVTVGTFPNQ
jgi:hypothetical protein